MNYKEFNDYELLYILNENEDASEILYNKYKGLITKIANTLINKYSNIGLDINDLLQEGYIALYNATKSYDENNNATFFTYVCKCILNNMLLLLNRSNNKKNYILNNSISYNACDTTYDDKIININSNKKFDPINLILINEKNKDVLNSLNGYERDISICRILGFSNDEISKILDINKRTISNAITRIRNKYKNII